MKYTVKYTAQCKYIRRFLWFTEYIGEWVIIPDKPRIITVVNYLYMTYDIVWPQRMIKGRQKRKTEIKRLSVRQGFQDSDIQKFKVYWIDIVVCICKYRYMLWLIVGRWNRRFRIWEELYIFEYITKHKGLPWSDKR